MKATTENFFAKLNGKEFYWQFLSSLGKIKLAFLLKCMISANVMLPIYESYWFRFDRPLKTLVFYFSFFDFDDFPTAFAKSLMKKPSVFITDIKSSYKFLLSHKDLRSRNFWQWNDGTVKILGNLHGNAFSLFILIKWKIYCNVPFNDVNIMCNCNLFHGKSKLGKTTICKLQAVQDGVSFF